MNHFQCSHFFSSFSSREREREKETINELFVVIFLSLFLLTLFYVYAYVEWWWLNFRRVTNQNLEHEWTQEEQKERESKESWTFFVLSVLFFVLLFASVRQYEAERRLRKKVHILSFILLLTGKLNFLRLVGPLAVSEHRQRVWHIYIYFSISTTFMLEKRREKRKKERKKEKILYSQDTVNGIRWKRKKNTTR